MSLVPIPKAGGCARVCRAEWQGGREEPCQRKFRLLFGQTLAFCFLCCLSCGARAATADSNPTPPTAVWSGVVLATNNPHPSEAPPRLRKFADKLKNVFGYNQFELVGEYASKLDYSAVHWLEPSKDFSLSVNPHNDPARHNSTRIVLFQNHRQLAEFDAHLSGGSPLFIRGPQYAGDSWSSCCTQWIPRKCRITRF